MNFRTGLSFTFMIAIAGLGVLVDETAHSTWAQNPGEPVSTAGPDPREIPVPASKTRMKPLPGVAALPVRKALPDVLTMNNGKRVTSRAQWNRRRQEMRRILEYYAVGLAPPPPGNVKGKETKTQLLKGGPAGGVKYRLVHLTFGPHESLSLDIGIFTPVEGGPFPTVIMPGGTPPDATPLPRLPPGPVQGTGVDGFRCSSMARASIRTSHCRVLRSATSQALRRKASVSPT